MRPTHGMLDFLTLCVDTISLQVSTRVEGEGVDSSKAALLQTCMLGLKTLHRPA